MYSQGNVYFADRGNSCIRKIFPTGLVSTFAGGRSRTPGYVDGPAINARFSGLADIAIDKRDNLYVSEYSGIRKITPDGLVSTLAGNGISGFKDGTGEVAQIYNASGIAVDLPGYVYVADERNDRIRKISPTGFVTTLAGSGFNGYLNGKGSSAEFAGPTSVAVDAQGIVYVNDLSNRLIRKIDIEGSVSNFADIPNQFGYSDGPDSTARFRYPQYISVDKQGNVYVADYLNHYIRKISKR